MLYHQALEAAGYRLHYAPFFDDEYLVDLYQGRPRRWRRVLASYARRFRTLLFARHYDLLWIEKEAFPFGPGMVERLAGVGGVPIVVDFDDAIFHNYDQSRSPLVRALLSSKLRPLLRSASAVTAGNSYLADYASANGASSVMILPTVVDTALYTPSTTSRQAGSSPAVIGWIGSPATKPLLEKVIPELNVAAQHNQFILRTIGISQLPDAAFPVETLPWSAKDEISHLQGIDIGIMPLSDTPFERGKCGYKLIQYMAVAKPVIASPVGVNIDIVSPDVGILIDDNCTWSQAINKLINDPALCSNMGATGRRKCVDAYSLSANAPRLTELFDQLTI
jgi:glycosyltransferase involved in cell wall biosynthesis